MPGGLFPFFIILSGWLVDRIAVDLWAATLEKLKDRIGAQRFELWFKHTEPIQLGPDLTEIGTPNLFVAEWLQTHFAAQVASILAEDYGQAPEVKFRTSPRLFKEAYKQQLVAQGEIVSEAAATKANTPRVTRPRSNQTLANFIVGAGSRMAHACALEVVASSHCRYNPLFLYSDCGLGKTHLLNGVWNGICEMNDGRTVAAISAEVFTNEFIYAMNRRHLDAFRAKYRGVDVLLIDDVHFFNGKQGLQEELLHTFDALHRGNRQVVLASDTHPRKMSAFKRNLINRFVSGMVICMEPPDEDTRYRILVSKAATMGSRVGSHVLKMIAARLAGNVRDLEGALNAVVAYSRLCNRAPDEEMVREALRDAHIDESRALTITDIEDVVAEVFGVKRSALHSRRRSRKISIPRQACMSLARHYTALSCAEIAGHFGNKHHSSVLFAEKRTTERRESDPEFGARMAEVMRTLRVG